MMRRHWRGFRGSGFGPSMLALGAISALSILVTTRHGVGIDADSVAYVDLARHLRSGAGFALSPGLTPIADPQMLRPTAHFPPLYPVLLALGETIGLDVWTFARWLGAMLAGTTAVLIGAVIKDAKASPGRTLLVVWLTITAVDWLHVHAWAVLTNRRTEFVPWRAHPYTRAPQSDYASSLTALDARLREQPGVLVYFRWLRWRWYLAPERELVRVLALTPLLDAGPEGAVYIRAR